MSGDAKGGLVKARFPGENMWVQLDHQTPDGRWMARLRNNPCVLAAKFDDLVMLERDGEGRWVGSVLSS